MRTDEVRIMGKTPVESSKNSTTLSTHLSLILQDIAYLFNRGYDKRRAIDFVASRYLLDRSWRNFIFRTLSSDDSARQTKAKLLTVEQLRGQNLGVDGFNILITLQEMARNHSVYLCYDHVIRDTAGNYGRFYSEEDGVKAIQILTTVLLALPLAEFTIFLDEPVSHSGKVAGQLREELARQMTKISAKSLSADFHLSTAVATVKSPDHELGRFDVVASHDSVVIEKSKGIFDIPRHAIALGLLSPTIVDIRSLLQGSGEMPAELKAKLNTSFQNSH
ncbi:MAG: DUF434 domain-containing protein [Candidatus Hodarchaeales archaeon]